MQSCQKSIKKKCVVTSTTIRMKMAGGVCTLKFGTDDGSLKDAFSGFGEVVEARVIIDRNTGRSRH